MRLKLTRNEHFFAPPAPSGALLVPSSIQKPSQKHQKPSFYRQPTQEPIFLCLMLNLKAVAMGLAGRSDCAFVVK